MYSTDFGWPDVKRALARVPIVSALNRSLKARQTVAQYRSSCAYYADRPMPAEIGSRLRGTLERRGFSGRHRLKLFFVGTDEQQDKSGLLQALGKLAHTHWFTKPDGSYGHNDARSTDVRRSANADLLWNQLTTLAGQGWMPDIILAQTWASLIDPAVFSRARQQWGCLVVSLAMDDRHQYWGGKVGAPGLGTYALIPHIDLALTAAPECVAWYEKEGCPALYFPEASDPAIFHPLPNLPKVYDVSFVGARYGIRDQLVGALRKAGIRVSAFGSGWEAGRLDNDAVPRMFAQSKVLLGVGTIGYCHDFYALKLRDFDGPMSGSVYLTHANPDLNGLFRVGQEIVTYQDQLDCVTKTRYLLAHDDERERIAHAGRVRACAEHSWERRFGQLLATLGLGGAYAAEGENPSGQPLPGSRADNAGAEP